MPKSKEFQEIAKVNQASAYHLMKNGFCSSSITLKRLHGIEPKRHREYPKQGRRRVSGQSKDMTQSKWSNFLRLF